MKRKITLIGLLCLTILIAICYPPIASKAKKSKTKYSYNKKNCSAFEMELHSESPVFQESHKLDVKADSLLKKLAN